jgi:hypothetical protein
VKQAAAIVDQIVTEGWKKAVSGRISSVLTDPVLEELWGASSWLAQAINSMQKAGGGSQSSAGRSGPIQERHRGNSSPCPQRPEEKTID